ncbi:hypothetical protein, partial [Staphylococcus aureus]
MPAAGLIRKRRAIRLGRKNNHGFRAIDPQTTPRPERVRKGRRPAYPGAASAQIEAAIRRGGGSPDEMLAVG